MNHDRCCRIGVDVKTIRDIVARAVLAARVTDSIMDASWWAQRGNRERVVPACLSNFRLIAQVQASVLLIAKENETSEILYILSFTLDHQSGQNTRALSKGSKELAPCL